LLTAIRDKVSGWIAYFIVLLISIPFALWGIDRYFGSGGDDLVAADVNGVEIPLQAFTYQYQQQQRYLQQAYGVDFPANQNDAALKEFVLQGMVRQELLGQEAQQAGYSVSDQALLNAITQLDAFKTNGHFDERRYEQFLTAQGQTKAEFEQNLRRQLAVSYFEDGIQQSAFLPPSAEQRLLSLKNQRRDFAYFMIPVNSSNVDIGNKAISKYYESHQDDFKTPERVKVAYLNLSKKGLMSKIKPSEDALRKYYQSEADRYIVPEQRKARQILIKVLEGADKDVIDKARGRAKELATRAKAGENFSSLARKYSEDKLSASSGGDLGFIAPGDLSSEVEDVLFGLKKGNISNPIQTSLGFQIIQLVDIRPARQAPFDEAHSDVLRDYRQEKAQDRFIKQVEQLETLAYEQSTSLEPAAKALGLKVWQSNWVTRQQGGGIFGNPKVRDAAYSDDVLQDRHNSDVVELGPNHFAVLRIIEHEAAKPKPLVQVRDDIKQILAIQVARRQAVVAGQRALKELQSEKKIAKVAKQYRVTVKSPGFVKRTDTRFPEPIINKVFVLNKPLRQGEATFGGVELTGGGYAIIALHKVQAGDDKNKKGAAVASEPDASYGLRERDAAYQALEAAADIDIKRDNL